jgi:hypothetical protein
MRQGYVRTCNVFIIMYSITDKESFSSLDTFKDEILRVKKKYFKLKLVS